MPRGAFTAAGDLRINDADLIAGAEIDFRVLRKAQNYPAFVPQAVMCNKSSDAAQQASGFAFIQGQLFGSNTPRSYRIPLGHPTGLAFQKVFGTGTTAQEISLLSEV
jgi:hypothetical protein